MILKNSSTHNLVNIVSRIICSRYFYYGLLLGVGLCLTFIPFSFHRPKTNDIFAFKHPPQVILLSDKKPVLSTSFYILVDRDTNKIVLSQNEHSRIYPASTTKLATALTSLNIYPLDEIITAKAYPDGKIMELQDGEKISVKNLVSGLLVYSANDAAYNLASHHPNVITGFVAQMNLLAQKYGLKDTNFTNYDGLHDPLHYSTPYDLAELGRLASLNPIVTDTVKIKSINLSDISGEIKHHLSTTNELLGVIPEVEGLKTGWTPEASGSFIGLLNINGHYLISVVAQSEDRFNDTKLLVDWAKTNLTWRTYQ